MGSRNGATDRGGPKVEARRTRSQDTIENSPTSEIAMRYTKDQKQATRQRILEAAGRRFKQDGIDGAGVATLMSDAGLTNGAFYAHFSSKEDLVGELLVGQGAGELEGPDHQGEDAERLGACRGRIVGG